MKLFLSILLVLLLQFNLQALHLVNLADEKEVILHSKIENTDRELFIRVPKDYGKKNLVYPVVYLFDAHDKTLYNYTSATIDRLMWTHDIPDVILVGIAQNDRSKELSVERNEETSTLFLKFIVDELVPYVNKNYQAMDYRTFIGHSVGGAFVTNAMTVYPEIFNSVISISGALSYPAGEKFFKNKIFNNLSEYLANHSGKAQKYYFSVGNEGFQDEEFRKGAFKVDSLFRKTLPVSIDWKFNEFKGFNHGATPLVSIPEGLTFIFHDWHFSDSLAMSVIVYEKTDPIKALALQRGKINSAYQVDIPIPLFIYFQFADFYLQGKKYKEAQVLAEKLIEIDPNTHNAYGFMAEVLENTNNLKEAKNYYLKAKSKLEPSEKEESTKYTNKIKNLEGRLKQNSGMPQK